MGSDEKLENFISRFKKVYEDANHPVENKQAIKRFHRQGITEGKSEQTLKQRCEALTIFSKWCNIPFSQLTGFDIDDFLYWLSQRTYKHGDKEYRYSPYTIQTYKIILKQFFKSDYFENDHKTKICDRIKILKESDLEKQNERAKEGEVHKEILTEPEIYDLITHTQNDRDAMLIAVLYESGCRKGEFRASKVKHVKFEKQYCTLTFPKGKTGSRTVDLVFSRMYLDMWIRKHPQRLPDGRVDPEAFLLISTQNPEIIDGRAIYKPLSEWAITKQIQKAAKRAGITKPVNPHNFRHTRATKLAESPHWSDQSIKAYQGWSKDSKMLKRYVKNVQTRSAVLAMNDIEDVKQEAENTMRVIMCPNCHLPQPEAMRDIAEFCYSCGSPLTIERIKDYINTKAQILRQLNKASRQDLDLAKRLDELEDN